MSTKSPTTGSKLRILQAAERLFAQRGIASVSIRDIIAEVHLKNANSVAYYFGNKENLVREVLLTGARAAEERRIYWLDRLEAIGHPISVRDAIKVMLSPTVERIITPSFARLIAQVVMNEEMAFKNMLGRDLIISVGRCNDIFKQRISHLPPTVLDERIALFHIYFSAFLPTRDSRIETGEDDARWSSRHIVEHFLDTCESLLTGSTSKMTDGAREVYERRRTKFKGIVQSDSVQFDLFDDLTD